MKECDLECELQHEGCCTREDIDCTAKTDADIMTEKEYDEGECLVKKVSFRIRKQYYDKILSGEKTEELRQLKQFWIDRLFCEDPPQEAVFVCGSHVHRRKIEAIYYCIPEEMLGRDLSEQGKQDIQSEICICIELYYTVCERCCNKVLTVYPIHYNDEYDGEIKEMNVCWDCDFDLMNGRGEPNDDPCEIIQDRAVEAYENDPINEPYPYPI